MQFCRTPRHSLKVRSLTEDDTSIAPAEAPVAAEVPVAAENPSVKMEDASASLEFTDDHPDMAQYVSFKSFSISVLS